MSTISSTSAFVLALFDPAAHPPVGLRDGAGVDRFRRFSVHRNNVAMSLVDALAEMFPVTQALVGMDFFRAMARERVKADPPRSPVLTDYGKCFARFIEHFEPAGSVPYLADVARLEHARVEAFHAADALPVTHAEYQRLLASPELLATAGVTLHPSCRWLHSSFAVHSIWSAHQGLLDTQSADLSSVDISSAEHVLVARPSLEVHVAPISPDAIAFLEALAGGQSLGETMANTPGANEESLNSIFTMIVQYGLVIELNLPSE